MIPTRKLLPLMLFLCASAAVLLYSCSEPDIRLVNKVKTFDPKWTDLNDKLNYLDRNLDIAEERFETDFAEIDGMLSEIPDSLRGRKYRAMLKDYTALIESRDTIRHIHTDTKAEYGEAMQSFHVWEKMVMDGDVVSDPGLDTLASYRRAHKRMDHLTDSVTTVLATSFEDHNKILRDLTSLMGIFQNFDIRMQ